MSRKKKKLSKNSRRGRAKAAASRAAAEKARSDPKQLESLASQSREAGNYSRAREGYKRLHRLDPDRFEMPLLETTLLAARQFFEKKRFNDCHNLLVEFAKFKAPSEKDHAEAEMLERHCNLFHSNRKMRITAALALLANEAASEGSEFNAQAADVLVLEKHEAARDITDAISFLCSKEWDQLDLVLKKITRQSPFAGWRMFVTACAAFHRGDRDLARKCFARLSAGTLPDQKADAYRVMLGEIDLEKHSNGREVLGTFLGNKELFKYIIEADRHWKKGQIKRAEKALGRINGFPGFKQNFVGNLTRNFLNGLHHFAPDEQCEFTESNLHYYATNKKPGAMSFFRSISFISCFDEESDFENIVDDQWRVYEKSFASFFGNSRRFRAMSQLVKAKQNLAKAGQSFSFFDYGPPDLSGAISSLKKAIELDPEFEEAHSMLLDVYESTEDKRARNKLLDVMSARFPDSKEILKLAGRRCLDRSAFKKAIDYFERAEAIDPIDQSTKRELYEANLKLAIRHVVKDKAHLLRPVLERLPLYSQKDGGTVFFQNQFRAVFSDTAWMLTPSAKKLDAPDLPDNSISEEVSGALYSFYRKMSWDYIYFSASSTTKHRFPAVTELPKPSKKNATISDAVKMVKLQVQRHDLGSSKDSYDFFCDYVYTAIRYMKKDELPTIRSLALLIITGIPACKQFTGQLSEKTKKLDCSDLFFRIFRAIVEEDFPPALNKIIKNLGDIRSRDAELDVLIQRYELLREEIESPFGCPENFDPFGFGGDDEEFDDEDDFSLPPMPQLPSFPKPKPRPAKKAVKKKVAAPAEETPDDKEEDSPQQEFDFL